MKKILTLAALAGLTVTLSVMSCKKSSSNPVGNYTCTCIVSSSGVSDTIAYTYTNIAKNNAQTACTTQQTTSATGGITATCTLK